MKVFRSTLVAGVAIFAAACGDKVTVQGPTSPDTAAKVNSVTVSPANVTMTVGQTVTFTAVVDVTNGAAQTVTWSPTSGAVSVAATGVATANSATAGVAVCATSTADATKKGCAQAVVTASAPIIPATVSIQSVTVNGTNNVSVNPAAVAGAIDVRLNINPGNQTVTRVDLKLCPAATPACSTIVGSQTFTAAMAAALRFAADEALANQSTFPQVLFTVNTANVPVPANGAPQFLNGNYVLSASLTVAGQTSAPTATAQQALTLANVNTFLVTTTVGGATAATANNAAGFRYNRGDVTTSIVPVSFTGIALASATVNFGTLACDGGALGVQRSGALTAPAAGAFAWTRTWANTGAAAAGNMAGYTFNSTVPACAAANNTGEQISIVAAQDASGNPFTTTALPIVGLGAGFRIDNVAPTAPTATMTIPARRNFLSWVTDVIPFNRTTAGAGVGIISAASVEGGAAGSGVGLSTDETLVYTATVGGATVTSSAGLAESLTNTAYSVTVTGRDLLGNTSAASAAATFGVDRTIPTIAALGAPATGTAIAAPGGVTFGPFTYIDPATPPAGPSTPSATPARVDIQRRTTATASTRWNATAGAFNATGGPSNFSLAGPAIDPGATNVQAYYVVTAFVEDGAANPSLSVTRTYLYDITSPTNAFSIPIMTASAGLSNLFTASMTDNLDIAASQWFLRYDALEVAPGAAGANIRLPSTSIGAFESFTTTASSSADYPLLRIMLNTAGGAPAFPHVSNVGAQDARLQAVSHQVTDRAALTGLVTNLVPGANLPAMPAANPYAAAGFAGSGFIVSNAAVTVDISGNGAAPTLNSVDLTATATGTVNVMPNPFTRVDFFVYGGDNTYRYLGTATTVTVVDNAVNRVYTYGGVNWNPDAVGAYNNPNAAGAQTVIAIGWNATFDAVRTAGNASITTTP